MHVMSTRTLRRIAMQEDSLGRVDRLSHLVRRAVRETTSLQLKPLYPGERASESTHTHTHTFME